MSRVCEEGLAGSVLEALEQPAALTSRIIELRTFVRAKQAVEAAQKPEDVPDDPMVDLYFETVKRAKDG